MYNGPNPWTDEKLKTLAEMWADGASQGVIAAATGLSRSAVAGKISRLRGTYRGTSLERRVPEGAKGSDSSKTTKRLPRPKSYSARIIKFRSRADVWRAAPAIESRRVPFLDLVSTDCKWPLEGDGAHMICCGADAESGLPYCAGHCLVAYTQPQPRRVAA